MEIQTRRRDVNTHLVDRLRRRFSFARSLMTGKQRRQLRRHSPNPHFQIRHRRPDVALGPFRDLAGDGDGSAPAPGEEGREDFVFRWLEADRLEAGLEAFR